MSRCLGLLAALAPHPEEGSMDTRTVPRRESGRSQRHRLRQGQAQQHKHKRRAGKDRGFPLPALFRLRHRRGWTQEYLAARARLAFATVNRLESGQTTAYEKTVYKLARALGCTNAELMGELTYE
jgi:ribosome-binding protein aMBF1 (putative translation factor)